MPELPEVETLRLFLKPRVTGKRIQNVIVRLARIIRSGGVDSVIGSKITGIVRRGKHLKFETDSESEMFIHLRMSGTLLWSQSDEEPDKYVRASVLYENGVMHYRDIRTLGGIWIVNKGDFPFHRLGVEPLSFELTVEYLARMLAKRSIPIKVALLDQKIIAGIGNIYASEILFDCGINPRKPAKNLTEKEIERLIASTRKVLTAAIQSSGTTFRDFRLSNGKNGDFARFLKVYDRRDKPCVLCGAPIVRLVQAKRSSYLCPACQK